MTEIITNNSRSNHETIDEIIDGAADGNIPECEILTYDELLQLASAMTMKTSPQEIYESLEKAVSLSAMERDGLFRKIKKHTGTNVTALRESMCEIAPEANADKVDHLKLAQAIIEKIGAENLIASSTFLYRWHPEKGIWRKCDDRPLRQEIQRQLPEGVFITNNLIKSISEIINNQCFRDGHRWNINPDIINFTNGALHWHAGTWQLKDHCREDYCTTQIPHAYNPKATNERFEQFFDEVFRDDGDKAEKRALILQMMGYTLASHARYEAFIILIGSGANGKSVLLELLRFMIGAENVCGVQPSQFGNRFQRGHLDGKLANLVTEIAEGGEIDDAGIKAITSGELMTAEHKHKPPFDFMPFCTCWFGTNHLPHSSDYSDALQRRAKIVSFNRVFKAGIDQDPHLKRTLCEEIEGIIVLCLQAYGQVINTHSFTEPPSSIDHKRQWQLQNDQVRQFVEECCACDGNALVDSKTLYNTYKRWADEEGITRKLRHNSFSNRLRQFGCTPHKGTAGRRMIAGIQLKNHAAYYPQSGTSGALPPHSNAIYENEKGEFYA